MKYNNSSKHKKRFKLIYVLVIATILATSVISGVIGTRLWYENQLKPVANNSKVEVVDIPSGATVDEIANTLQEKGLIKNSTAFKWYVKNKSLIELLKAGTYEIDAANSTPEIVTIITDGKVRENLVTILPGQRISQIKEKLIKYGYTETEVDEALKTENYKGHPALVAKPTEQSLEGYLYPESFKITSTTSAVDIIEKALDEMADNITPGLIDIWQKHGLGIHQAISLASIVEKEVSNPSERKDVAGVFINRLEIGMKLESDPTYKYAGYLTNQPPSPAIDSPYNTYKYPDIPPGPISNVSKSSLEAVAYPSNHEFLYFVAGDDGITRFSKTLQEHEEKTAKYCIELCKSY